MNYKVKFLSEDTDTFVITSNRRKNFPLKLKIWILVIFKAALASQRQPSCPYKALSFQTLRHPQFLSNFHSLKFKFSVSGKENVRLLEVIRELSVSSVKNVPLTTYGALNFIARPPWSQIYTRYIATYWKINILQNALRKRLCKFSPSFLFRSIPILLL